MRNSRGMVAVGSWFFVEYDADSYTGEDTTHDTQVMYEVQAKQLFSPCSRSPKFHQIPLFFRLVAFIGVDSCS